MTEPRNDPHCGVIYIATGSKRRAEAVDSVRSLKATNPNLSVTLFTDSNETPADFDNVVRIQDPAFTSFDKVAHLSQSPYQKTLYLDSDTFISDNVEDIFTLLDQFDFAAAIEVSRGYWYRHLTSLPDSFPELNSGVLAYRRSPAVEHLFKKWSLYYKESLGWQRTPGLTNRVWDQPSLRQALYQSGDIKLACLPTEYNALQITGTFVWGKAKILHGRNKPGNFETALNRHSGQGRVYLQQIGTYRGWENMTCKELLAFAFRVNAVVALRILRTLTSPLRRRTPARQGTLVTTTHAIPADDRHRAAAQ